MEEVPQFGIPTGSYLERPGAYAIIFDDAKRLLVVSVHGSFYLPGGGIDRDEIPEQALAREVKEETGYTVGALRRIGRANQFISQSKSGPLNKLGTFFVGVVDHSSQTLGIEPDHTASWITPEQLLASESHDFLKWAVRKALEQSS